MRSKNWPPLLLLVLTPLVAEYLLGSLSFGQIVALPVLCLMYGGGAVVIRELARATNGGWRSILLLGVAYALLEEGLVTQSLFNPHYLHLRLLDYGYLPAFGTGLPWLINVVSLHVMWSVCVPIGLTEAIFSRHGRAPWLGVRGRVLFGIFLVVGAAAIAHYTHKTEAFLATPLQLVSVSALIVVFSSAGLIAGRWRQAGLPRIKTPPPRVAVALTTFLIGSAFELTQRLQTLQLPWLAPVLVMLALDGAGIWLLRRWSGRRDWSPAHAAAAAIGGLLVYCWWGYSVEISLHGRGHLAAHSVLVGAAVLLAALAWRRSRVPTPAR